MLGNFDKGKEADFVVLDWNAGQTAMRWHQSLDHRSGDPQTMDQAAQLLFGIMAVGDDRNVDETWIAGQRAYKKSGCGSVRSRTVDVRVSGASSVIVHRVPAEGTDNFLEWQHGISGCHGRVPGLPGHRRLPAGGRSAGMGNHPALRLRRRV